MNEAEQILQRTNGGYEVFRHFLGDKIKKRLFLNPFRGDTNPSCHLYLQKGGDRQRYYLKDFGSSEWSGDCFSIAGKIMQLNPKTAFMDILRKIDCEMGLCIFSHSEGISKSTTWSNKTSSCKESGREKPIAFRATCRDFTEEELCFWQRYGINKTTLHEYNVRSIHQCQFKREGKKAYNIYSRNGSMIFGYFLNQERGLKLYMPSSTIRFMYAGILPSPYIFGYDQLTPSGDVVFITGGEKDVLSLASHGFNAISLNSETARISQSLIEELSNRFKQIIFLYDCDETGKRESSIRVEEYRDKYPVRRLELPLHGTKTEKDISDFFAMGNTPDKLRELLNNDL